MEILVTTLKKSAKSWTVIAAVLIWALSFIPGVLDGLLQIVTPEASPVWAARITALALLITRLRSVLLPLLVQIRGDDKPAE